MVENNAALCNIRADDFAADREALYISGRLCARRRSGCVCRLPATSDQSRKKKKSKSYS
jgi:hypothetical protein